MELLGYFDSITSNRVKGWAKYAESEREVEVLIKIGDRTLSAIANKYREGLKLKGIHPTGSCAFDVDISQYLPEGENTVKIDVSVNGKSLKNSPKTYSYGIAEKEKNRLALIHIPKTAGTSINQWVQSSLNPDYTVSHLESRRELHSRDALGKYLFISGHVNYGHLTKLLNEGFKLAVVLREPMQQLISHINWVWYISSDISSAFFQNHSKEIKELSLRLRSADFSKPARLEEFISELSSTGISLFDNCQTRYLLEQSKSGQLLNRDDLSNAIINLGKMDFIGQSEELQPFVGQIGEYLGLDVERPVKKLNTRMQESIIPLSETHQELLLPLIELDCDLLQAAKKKMVK